MKFWDRFLEFGIFWMNFQETKATQFLRLRALSVVRIAGVYPQLQLSGIRSHRISSHRGSNTPSLASFRGQCRPSGEDAPQP